MSTTVRSRVPMFSAMNRIPGGLMLVPLVLGSLVGTFAMPALEIGSFTSALPLIALLIFMTGTQVTGKTGGPVLAHAGVVLLMKSLIPAGLVVALGHTPAAGGEARDRDGDHGSQL